MDTCLGWQDPGAVDELQVGAGLEAPVERRNPAKPAVRSRPLITAAICRRKLDSNPLNTNRPAWEPVRAT